MRVREEPRQRLHCESCGGSDMEVASSSFSKTDGAASLLIVCRACEGATGLSVFTVRRGETYMTWSVYSPE